MRVTRSSWYVLTLTFIFKNLKTRRLFIMTFEAIHWLGRGRSLECLVTESWSQKHGDSCKRMPYFRRSYCEKLGRQVLCQCVRGQTLVAESTETELKFLPGYFCS